ncbi:COX4-domain-containing protein [Patellaria atrata CBS 101060]|uniref:Cytochrome c oxidase polypeptide V n=1 Tax=Patellaria atrata CBS 101060 TaxID=1346257 RepID=A0A9P4VSC7_9PEZI|nr:COX4-domain-containing protein [Patellaria atrata CBS 101060]
MLRTSLLRAGSSTSFLSSTASRGAVKASPALCIQQQTRAAHAISNPTLANIEKRWEGMPPQEQADLWMQLRDRMKADWHELTLAEKKAAYWIAFGPHGPRAEAPPGETRKVILYTFAGVFVSFIVFATTRHFAGPPPRSMTKEWQEATEEYMRENKMEPITGYKGMMVQSPLKAQSGVQDDEDEE